MKKNLLAVFATGLLVLGVVGMANALPVQWATGDGANGHWYEIVDGTLSWADAKIDAENAGGYLATITTEKEQDFVAFLIAKHVQGYPDIGDSGYMLGGFQPANSNEPAGNWQWVTSETWSYTKWGSGEPNNAGVENYLYMDERYSWAWNDYININAYYKQPSGYIIESVPEPATMLLLASGLLGMAAFRRKFNK